MKFRESCGSDEVIIVQISNSLTSKKNGSPKMETASSSAVIHAFHSNHHTRICSSQLYCRNPNSQLRFLPLFPLTSFKTVIFHSKNLQFNVSTGALGSPLSSAGDNLSQKHAVLLEVDG